MVPIRLLTSVVGGPVEGAAGDVVLVDEATASIWADGERAERVVTPTGKDYAPSPEGELDAPPLGEQAIAPPRGQRATKR